LLTLTGLAELWGSLHREIIIYIAGETLFCKKINAYFRKTKQVETKRIYTKPFWHPDKKGLE
jgi:NADPH-dependent ferric siderophore reductase